LHVKLRSSTPERATSEVLRPAESQAPEIPQSMAKFSANSLSLYISAGGSGVKKLILFSCLMTASPLLAQTQPPKQAAFEVASVKPSRPGSLRGPSAGMLRGCNGTVPQIDRGRFAVTNISVYMLIVWAYDMGNCLNVASYDLITGGQKWTESDLFDLEAVIPEGDHTKAQLATMIQALLAERFKLVVHREARDMPVYALTVAKGGPKLRQVAEGDCVVRPSGDMTRSGTDNKPWCGEGGLIVGFDRKGTADVRA